MSDAYGGRMTEVPFRDVPPPPPPRRRSFGIGAWLLIGILIGALVGGLAGGYVAQNGLIPSGIVDRGPLPGATPINARAISDDPVVQVVDQLLPAVVTVINKLPNGSQQSSGTGFVIDASRGYIVTNNHVIENVRDSNASSNLEVIFSDNRVVSARLVGRDQLTDVAVLQVTGQNLTAAQLANSDDAPVGSRVVAIGSALGTFENTVTTGVVSAKGRRVQESADVFLEDLVQTDAAINSGNSGGPLIWANTSQVIGMNTLVAGNAEGLGFAVSSNTIRTIANEIIASGRVPRGSLGIVYIPVSSRSSGVLGIPGQVSGVRIEGLTPGAPAASAGLRVGDVITKIDDQQIDGEHPVRNVLAKYRPGDTVALTYVRGTVTQTAQVTLS